jgi:hypothetical protein
MKKFIFVLAMIAGSQLAKAQQNPTRFGLKGGINLSTITGDNSGVFSSSLGAYFGGMARIPVATQFSIQPEAMLSFEGAKFNTAGVSGKVTASFVNLPVLGQYHAGGGFIIQSGPQLGLLLGATQKITNGGSQSVKDQLKSTNFSWVFGAAFQPKNTPVGFNIRYNLGLSNINSGNGATNRTSVWQLGTYILLGK